MGALLGASTLALAGGGGYELKSDSETITAMSSGGMTIKCPQGSAVVGGGYLARSAKSRGAIRSAFPDL